MSFYQQPFGFYQQPSFGQQPYGLYQQPSYFGQQPFTQPFVFPGGEPLTPQTEQSFIENILRLNIGKVATVYMSFEGSQWGSKIFKGYILAAGKDHLVLKDLQTETRYVLLMVYLSYVTFEEEIEYEYPFRKCEKNP
ncbi:MAG: spore coat protein GerQ [Bacilli bacterium]|nr:spore coat protein GerQ [Bacilli bacterium]MDD4076590.1 spore coat protein GerQ [Bacilli bacterium]MDD4387711.1 spore coat protein GerQ [Bacilli bacterium]